MHSPPAGLSARCGVRSWLRDLRRSRPRTARKRVAQGARADRWLPNADALLSLSPYLRRAAPYDAPERYAAMFRTRPPEDQLNTKLTTEALRKLELDPGTDALRLRSVRRRDPSRRRPTRRVLRVVGTARRLASTIVVLLSDHGEEFGEHGTFGHGITLYIQAIHIPLIIVAPGIAPSVVREAPDWPMYCRPCSIC